MPDTSLLGYIENLSKIGRNIPASLQAPLHEPEDDPEMVEQMRSLHELRRMVLSSPFMNGVALVNPDANGNPQGYTFASGETKTISHGMGRPWRGVLPVLAAISTGDVTMRLVANPSSQVTADQAFSVRSANACTVYFYVF